MMKNDVTQEEIMRKRETFAKSPMLIAILSTSIIMLIAFLYSNFLIKTDREFILRILLFIGGVGSVVSLNLTLEYYYKDKKNKQSVAFRNNESNLLVNDISKTVLDSRFEEVQKRDDTSLKFSNFGTKSTLWQNFH